LQWRWIRRGSTLPDVAVSQTTSIVLRVVASQCSRAPLAAARRSRRCRWRRGKLDWITGRRSHGRRMNPRPHGSRDWRSPRREREEPSRTRRPPERRPASAVPEARRGNRPGANPCQPWTFGTRPCASVELPQEPDLGHVERAPNPAAAMRLARDGSRLSQPVGGGLRGPIRRRRRASELRLGYDNQVSQPYRRRSPAQQTPANPPVGDAGLEPATSALSRRRSPS
jgi:hypothetical protein